MHGNKDFDGFYRGELNGHLGLVPGNMVAEVGVDELSGGVRDMRIPDGLARSAYADLYTAGPSAGTLRRRSEFWPANGSDPTLSTFHRLVHAVLLCVFIFIPKFLCSLLV